MFTETNANSTPGFLQVLMALKENINNDLQVATVAIVNNIDETNGTAMCQDFGENISFQAYYCYNLDVQQGDIAIVLFADKDFRTNLKNYKRGSVEFVPNSELENRHTKANGIIVGILYRR